MYKPVEKFEENKSRSAAQKKTNEQGFGMVDSRPKIIMAKKLQGDIPENVNGNYFDSRIKPLASKKMIQRKVTGFDSDFTNIPTAAISYIDKTDANTFQMNPATNEDMPTSLNRVLPHSVDSIKKITNVTANIKPNGPSEWDRNGTASANIGRAGRQEAILSTGSDPYYQGGHLISHSLLGVGSVEGTALKIDSYENIVPMEAAMNNMTFKKIETKLSGLKKLSTVSIDVKSKDEVSVSHLVVSKLTGCPIKSGYNGSMSVDIPSATAREVQVSINGETPDSAQEIRRLSPHTNGIMNTGIELLDYMDETGGVKWMSKTLENKIKVI